jgi:NAD(P)-dependent dehydrogenase (short-subunit alcohol dehydrogenase family)
MPFADHTDVPLSSLLDLTGATAVVTGGAMGLGHAIARRLVEAGASVILADIDGPLAERRAAALAERGGTALGVAFDATVPAAHDALAARAVAELGGLDVWVNNAGIYPFVELLDMSDADWRRVLSLNLDGVYWGCRAAGRAMRDAGRGGCIINLSSTAGYRAVGVGIAHYAAAKHGVRGLTKSAAVELGPFGIRVVALAPTYVVTEGTSAQREEIGEGLGDDPLDLFAQRLAAGRAGVPDDVARVALFCASPLAGFVTGATIPVDGGDLAL